MSLLTCPYCGAETPDKYNFCISCDRQVKCVNSECGEKLIAGKTFCFTCGQPLASINSSQSQPNKYVRDVRQKGKNYEERTEFSVSDHAVSELAPFIIGQMTSSPRWAHESTRVDTSLNARRALNTEIPAAEVKEIPLPSETEREVKPGQTPDLTMTTSRYFERDGDFLVATEKDFKGKTWADQQRHFVLLYASAYLDVFKKAVPSREHFKTAAEKANVYDASNFVSRYMKQLVSEHLTELSDGYKLNDRGNKEVMKILTSCAS